ncbi:MAG: BMP family ABC transporter substrate-binding protein [Erysipelotrichaceae bacterium]|nr:BMP family ABC transporter substrate-binding protein [Erysipelotrichaceae bacterium]
MKKLFALLLSVMMVLSLAACSSNKTEDNNSTAGDNSAPVADRNTVSKIAVILPGSITDQSWNQSAYEGLMTIESQGYEVAYTENVDVATAEAVARSYAEEGFDFIIGHGAQYGQAICNVAEDFDTVNFFITGNAPEDIAEEDLPKNIMFADYRECEGAYVSGVIAALMTQTGVVGYIGGGNNTTQQSDKNAFVEGVKSINANVEVKTVITGTFDDSNLGYETAKAMHEAGADVILQTCDHTGLGALQYCSENGVWCIGYTSDQSALVEGGKMLTSMLIDIPFMISSQTDLIKAGNYGGQSFPGLHDGVVSIAAFSSEMPEEVATQVNDIIAKIVAGEIVVTPNYSEN